MVTGPNFRVKGTNFMVKGPNFRVNDHNFCGLWTVDSMQNVGPWYMYRAPHIFVRKVPFQDRNKSNF